MTLRTITFDDSIYKLVPLEPSNEMLDASWKYHSSSKYAECVLPDDVTDAECYKAMIAAAPEGEKPSCRQCGAQAGNGHCLGDIFNCSDLAAPEGGT